MPILANFPTARQKTENSCWACAAREISNWYKANNLSGDNPIYGTDQKLATAWAEVTEELENADINIQQSASAALYDLGYNNAMDERALPLGFEILDQIEDGQPLLAMVGNAVPEPNPNPDAQNGHWVVIIGISDDQQTINVFDPDDGLIHNVPYDEATYQEGMYWQSTSYVDGI